MKRFRPSQLALLFAALLAGTGTLWACTVPVFRYALDRWHPDPYGVHVSEAWLKTDQGKQFAEQVSELSRLFQIVAGEVKEGEVTLLQPSPGSPEVWRGKPDVKALKELLNSPARRQIAEQIMNGASVVFAVVQSGNTNADTEFEASLGKRLNYLGQVMSIPPQDPFDPENKLGPGPELKVHFATVKIKRDDPKEQFLIRMLAGQNGDKLLESDQPFAAPIFGRGRALGAWKAEDLDDEGIDELCQFLLGACSCQVKAQNPGWDILIGTDWDEGLMKVAMARETEIANAESEPETTTTEAASATNAVAAVPPTAPNTNSAAPETVTFTSTSTAAPIPVQPPKWMAFLPVVLIGAVVAAIFLLVSAGRRNS